MKNVQCPFRRFRSSSLMRGNQCGKERKEARRILHSRAQCFDILFKYRCTFYKVLNYQLSVTGGSSFVQRTQILSTFFRGFLLFILSFIFVFSHGFLELILRKRSFLCFLCQKCLFGERKCLLLTQLEKRSFFQ